MAGNKILSISCCLNSSIFFYLTFLISFLAFVLESIRLYFKSGSVLLHSLPSALLLLVVLVIGYQAFFLKSGISSREDLLSRIISFIILSVMIILVVKVMAFYLVNETIVFAMLFILIMAYITYIIYKARKRNE